jgi:hypothetical protein
MNAFGPSTWQSLAKHLVVGHSVPVSYSSPLICAINETWRNKILIRSLRRTCNIWLYERGARDLDSPKVQKSFKGSWKRTPVQSSLLFPLQQSCIDPLMHEKNPRFQKMMSIKCQIPYVWKCANDTADLSQIEIVRHGP